MVHRFASAPGLPLLAPLDSAGASHISFLSNSKLRALAAQSSAAALIGQAAEALAEARLLEPLVELLHLLLGAALPGDVADRVTLQTPDGPVTWKPLTKDGAPLHIGHGSATLVPTIAIRTTLLETQPR